MQKLIVLALVVLSLGLLSCALLQPQRTSVAEQSPSVSRRPADLGADVAAIDPKKKTVCSMTMNSEHERETFKKYLPDFNFIELVTDSSEWLKESCQSGVKCDVLLVSGHFAGNFWGSSGQLDLADAEAQACNNACPGIFQHPKEAYLFGCNTLGGKTADFRSPEEYRAVLIADGIEPAQADLIAAFRYSPLGDSFHDRMRAMFSGTRTSLYGFSSIAPSGGNVEAFLQNYLRNVNDKYGDFGKYLDQMDPASPNNLLANALRVTTFAQGSPPRGITNASCILSSKGRINEKLQWIDSIFRDPTQILAKLPQVDQYLENLERNFPKGLPEAEASYFERLQFNTAARDHTLAFVVKRIPGIWSAQGTVLNFAKRVGWLNQREYSARVKNLIGDLFQKEFSINDADSFCSANLQLDIASNMLPPPPWGEHTIRALTCSRTHDTGVVRELARRAHTEPGLIEKLRALGSIDPEVIDVALLQLQQGKTRIRRLSLEIILQLQPADPRLRGALRQVLNDESFSETVLHILTRRKIFDQEFAIKVSERLVSQETRVASMAFRYFKEMKPQDENIQMAIVQAVLQFPKRLGVGLDTLNTIQPRSLHVRSAMMDLLTVPLNRSTMFSRSNVLDSILDMIDLDQPVSEDLMIRLLMSLAQSDLDSWAVGRVGRHGRLNGQRVQDFMIGSLDGTDEKLSDLVRGILRGNRFKSKAITDILMRKLFDPSARDKRPGILLALSQSEVMDAVSLRKMGPLMKDPEAYVRNNAVSMFEYFKTDDPVIREGLVAALDDESDRVRSTAVKAMSHVGGWDQKKMSIFMDKMEVARAFELRDFIEGLEKLKPTFSSILIRAAKFLSHEDPEIRSAMESTLRAIRPHAPDVLRAIRTHNPGLADSLGR